MVEHPAPLRRRSLLRGLPILLVGIASTLLGTGCSNPQSGGGTELPIQVRIYTGVDAEAWRLWSIEETPSAARPGAETSSLTFVSRGIFRDSAGFLDLPATSGLFLLEAWVRGTPDDFLEIRRPVPTGFRIDSSCVQSIPVDSSLHRTQVCLGLDASLAPSGEDSSTRPDRLTILRMESDRIQRLQLLDDAGSRALTPREARLWSVSGDASKDQTLVFRGVLTRESDGTFRLPTARGTIHYLLEAADSETDMPERVPGEVRIDSGWTRYMDCQETILPPLPGTLSVHACPELSWTPSGRDSSHVGADTWSAFTLQLP